MGIGTTEVATLRILTIGHGTLGQDDFASLVSDAGITTIVDIRSFPGSRHNPQFGSDVMARWLPEADISYAWIKALGGRRKEVPHSEHVMLRHPAFRAYADHMETDEFLSGLDELLPRGEATAVMCSESVWWRCHRRLLADHLVLVRQIEVVHLMHDGRLTPHPPTPEARLDSDRVVYDVGANLTLDDV